MNLLCLIRNQSTGSSPTKDSLLSCTVGATNAMQLPAEMAKAVADA